jgi:hypothetical protein
MSSIELDTAYERHEFLPLAVNWLGKWDAITVYFKNDVVTSPLNTASYIMIGPQTSIQGGDDPSINTTSWFQYGRSIDTVQNITVGPGIELLGSDTNPIVKNTGVVSIVPGDGFSDIGTASDPILACETLTAIVPGLGIDVFGIPIPNIVNTGVTYIREGAGIALNYTNQEAYIFNGGIQSLTAAPTNPGLTVSAGPIKTITNTGLLSVLTGTGIINDNTPTEPELRNGGVVSLVPSNASVTITGNGSVLNLVSNNPRKTTVWLPTAATVMTPNPVGFPANLSTIPITQAPGLWANCLATGQPYNSGYFALNIPFTFHLNATFFTSTQLFIYLVDTTNNVQFPILYRVYNPRVQNNIFVRYCIGTVLINLFQLRSSGFRVLSAIQVQGGIPIYLESVGGPAYATYYPIQLLEAPTPQRRSRVRA